MNSQHKKIFFGKRHFIVSESVYEPAEDTFILARNLNVKEGERVLDMGAGCGILSVLAAEKAGKVVAVDINPHAVACVKKNAEMNDVAEKVEVREGDLFEAVKDGEKFDLILFNAPYLPVGATEGRSWAEKAWAGGKTGRTVINRFIGEASKHLEENGRILLVQSSLSNVEKTVKRFSQHQLKALVLDEEKLDFEKIVLIEARKNPWSLTSEFLEGSRKPKAAKKQNRLTFSLFLVPLGTSLAAEHMFFAFHNTLVDCELALIAGYLHFALFTLDKFGHFLLASFLF